MKASPQTDGRDLRDHLSHRPNLTRSLGYFPDVCVCVCVSVAFWVGFWFNLSGLGRC